ncbi:Arm DNA-binding domain-containing protein [Glaciecola punicea]
MSQRNGQIVFDFQYQNFRCREQTSLQKTYCN